jgi:hypothetical protein
MSKEPKDHPQATVAPTETTLPHPDQPADQVTMVKALDFPSINEPRGAITSPPAELPPLVLTSISPDTLVITAEVDFGLTLTGSGFDATCLIVFDDEELDTDFLSETELGCRPPMAAAAGIVDVEVSRGGEELSEVLTFEFTAVAGTRSRKEPERKAKKDTPTHKRAKKRKGY